MNFSVLFDTQSLLLVLSSLLIGFTVGGSDLYKSLNLSKNISIPLGISGTLTGFIMMLSNLIDSSALTIALLPSIYGIFLSILLDAILSRMHSPAKSAVQQKFQGKTIGGCILILALPSLIVILNSTPAAFIDFAIVIIVLLGAPLLSFLAGRTSETRIKALGKYGPLLSFVAILCSLSVLFTQWNDPMMIGPAIAVGLLSLLYGGVLYLLSQVMHYSLYERSLFY